MLATIAVPLLLLLSAQIVTGDGTFLTEGDVLVLSPDNFQLALQRFPSLMVQFYAPWCPHCQALAPKFRNAAAKLVNSPVKLAKLDASRFQHFAQQHGVDGYPTLMFYRDGAGEEYGGPHEEPAIVRWLSRNIRSARHADLVMELSGGNFEAAITANPFLMVQFYAPWCPYCQELAPIYAGTAAELVTKDPRIKLAKLDATKDRSLAEWYGVKRYPTLVFFRHGVPMRYEGVRDQPALVRWMVEQVRQDGKSVVKFRSEDGQQPVVGAESTTKSASKKTVPVMINLIAMVVVSTVLG
ncbi:probable protein disulfide-isomerase A4 [Culex pipiens pallens]|uniref:probable protein disulfide-isomerase A4 n=1 Tax=Culex pipiens pallens TaxID=42434 RepID=UPI001954D4FB|nr:probable protein disulfide-isomerase A4 [Culex pipiens pallens]